MSILNNLGLQGQKSVGTPGLESESKNFGVVGSAGFAGMAAALAVAESVNDLNEINFQVAQVDALTRLQGRLQGIVERVSNTTVDGMSQREALLVTDSINEINEELGADLVAMPAVESFGDKISAKTYTEVGLEAADKGIDKVWQFILDSIKKIKDMFATWWDKFFGDVEKLKSYGEKVKAAADKYQDDKEDKKITIKGKLLYTKGAKPTAASIKSGMDSVEKSVSSFLNKQSATAEAVTDALNKAMDKADGTDANLKAAYDAFVGTADVAKYLGGAHIGTVKDGVLFGADIMGGKHVVLENAATIPSGASDDTAQRSAFYGQVAKVAYKVKGADEKKGSDKDVTIDRLSQSDVEAVADSAISAAEAILDMRKSRQDARKYADEITKAAEGLKKEAEGLEDKEKANKGELTNMSKAAVAVLKEVSGGAIAAWTAHVVTVSNAALKAAESSL